MAETTLISWADRTWSPWTGCAKVSPACDGCYAEFLMDTRHHRAEWGKPGAGAGTRSLMSDDYWRKPLTWNRAAGKAGDRPFVFPSLCDPFDNAVPIEWLARFLDLIRDTPNLVWLLLTKRPQLALKRCKAAGYDTLPANAAVGATCEDDERARINLPALCQSAAFLRPAFLFVSYEPMLGPIADTLAVWLGRPTGRRVEGFGYVTWVITGGETDQGRHRARPWNPEWVRDVLSACIARGALFHHKQNGEWVSVSEVEGPGEHFTFPDHRSVRRVGRARSGRTIDGLTYDARPAA